MMRASSIKTIAIIVGLASLATGIQANAQVSVGVGVYSGPYGYPRYPYFGAYPLNYRGFYGHGMSMYGPPVPTYGATPGTFGASDNRVNQNGPAVGFPIGIYATYSRPRYLVGEPLPLDGEAIRAALKSDALMVEVRVPLENAIVFINDRITKQNGQVRHFSSPPLQSGERYQYSIRAVWTMDGQRNDKTLKVEGAPGELAVADFLK